MANVEQISQVAMQVITYAGMAKSNYLEALKYYRENDQTAYEQSMSNGDVSFSQAHEAHLQLLQQEMNTQEPQITMLMAHAEDQLMSAETIKTLIQEIILLIENKMTIWADIQTKNGFASDEVQSSLQKYIRRAKVEEACQAAYELYTSGPVFLDKMWSRLETIAVEDVGFGDLNVPVLIHALDQMRKNFPYNDGDQPMYFIHAIRVLCTCTKDRSSDYLKNIIIKESAMGKVVEVPDIALDKHTKRGQEMGRGSKHFFEEATKVIPQLEIDNDYRERYGKILETYDPDHVVENAFKYSSEQY